MSIMYSLSVISTSLLLSKARLDVMHFCEASGALRQAICTCTLTQAQVREFTLNDQSHVRRFGILLDLSSSLILAVAICMQAIEFMGTWACITDSQHFTLIPDGEHVVQNCTVCL